MWMRSTRSHSIDYKLLTVSDVTEDVVDPRVIGESSMTAIVTYDEDGEPDHSN